MQSLISVSGLFEPSFGTLKSPLFLLFPPILELGRRRVPPPLTYVEAVFDSISSCSQPPNNNDRILFEFILNGLVTKNPKIQSKMSVLSSKLASYFVIGGLESSTGLEPDDQSRADLTDNPLERSYKPAILRHLPDASSWSNYNPEALSRLILPNGLKFCTDKEVANLKPKSHSFVRKKNIPYKESHNKIVSLFFTIFLLLLGFDKRKWRKMLWSQSHIL